MREGFGLNKYEITGIDSSEIVLKIPNKEPKINDIKQNKKQKFQNI